MSSGACDDGAERLGDRLVAEAHAEERDAGRRGARTTAIDAPASAGVPGPGEMSTPSYVRYADAAASVAIASASTRSVVGAELLQVADERVDEAVVVVDDEDAGIDRHGRTSLDGDFLGIQELADPGEDAEEQAVETTAASSDSRMSSRTHHGPGRTRQSAAYIRRTPSVSDGRGVRPERGVNDSNTP